MNNTMDKMVLAYMYIVLNPSAVYYTFYSVVHGTFLKKDYILGHEVNLAIISK
jgi:hypothetical protein